MDENINNLTNDDNEACQEVKKISFKEKLIERKKKRFFSNKDIKYKGILSYRYLRILAWISIAVAQAIMLNNLCESVLTTTVINKEFASNFLNLVSSLSVPLFIIATFATILNKSKSIKSVLITYGIAYIGMAIAIIILYYHYINSILLRFEMDNEAIKNVGKAIGSKLEINVFSDLLFLSFFYFFVMYNPKKYFQGKKIYIFRLLSLIPLLIAFSSYLIKGFANLGYYSIPFAISPFLTTKPPFIYLLFIIVTLWLKHQEKSFIKLGGNKEDYSNYEKTNKNSLRFSIIVSLLMLLISILEYAILFGTLGLEAYSLLEYIFAFQFGDCTGLFLGIPFILLFSYNKTHKKSNADLYVVMFGIGLIAFTYVEMIYRMALIILSA